MHVQGVKQSVLSLSSIVVVENWLQYTQNRVAQFTCVINSAFLLVITATPIDCAHYAQLASYVQVMVINSIGPGIDADVRCAQDMCSIEL